MVTLAFVNRQDGPYRNPFSVNGARENPILYLLDKGQGRGGAMPHRHGRKRKLP